MSENHIVEFDDNNGDMFTVDEFVEMVKSGGFINYDGSGYYSNGQQYFRDTPAIPSSIYRDGPDFRYSHVAWFNR